MSNTSGVWTSEEVALVLIDYREEMFGNVKSETTSDKSRSACSRQRGKETK